MRVAETSLLRGCKSKARRGVALVCLSALLWLSWSSSGLAYPGAVPPELILRAQALGALRVIIQLDVPVVAEGLLPSPTRVLAQRQTISAAQDEVLAALAGIPHPAARRFETIPFLALEASAAALAALESSPRVSSVVEDRALPPTLAESAPLVGASDAWAAGLDGQGWVVAVLDTGVDGAHPFLAGKVVAEACFSAGRDCPNHMVTQIGPGAAVPCSYAASGCRHGTHVAGIAAGKGASFSGVAREATLIAVQVFSKFVGANCFGASETPCALSYVSDQIAGLEHVYSLRGSFQIAAANLSLGGGSFTSQSQCDAQEAGTKAVVDNLQSVGIATAIAAGNDGFTNALSSPGCISSAVSVGSTTKTDQVSSFSNSASFLSLLAPGSSIQSSVPGGGFAVFSGTSMATPHVAGAWAILKQGTPAAGVGSVLQALQATGLPIYDPRNGITKRRIRILRASDYLACGGPTDTDADGIFDGCDTCPLDPANDADGDGVCGNLDVCPGFDDAIDADGDGIPDGCDTCPLDPANDADGDGVCGNLDVCPGFDDAIDADGDGIPDGCEAVPSVPTLGLFGIAILVLALLASATIVRPGSRAAAARLPAPPK